MWITATAYFAACHVCRPSTAISVSTECIWSLQLANKSTARLFSQGGRRLYIQILPGQCRPHQPFLASETRNTGLPIGEDRIPLCALIFTQYQSVTDRQTDGFAVAYTVLAKLCFDVL